MKIQTRKIVKAEIYVVDWDQQLKFPVEFGTYLNTMQRDRMGSDPRMFLQFAEFMKTEAMKEKGVINPEIMATLEVMYNGRGPYNVFDVNRNLLEVDYSPFEKADWVLEDE